MSKINPISWTTQKIKDLLIQIDQTGSIPRYNPFYNNDSTLLAPDLKLGLTKEEVIDRTRVSKDVFYFATTHATVKNDDSEVKKIKELRTYQKNLIHHFVKYKFNVVLASRQIGKCVHPFTNIEASIGGAPVTTMPIFELFYKTKPTPSFYDKMVYRLVKAAHKLTA